MHVELVKLLLIYILSVCAYPLPVLSLLTTQYKVFLKQLIYYDIQKHYMILHDTN